MQLGPTRYERDPSQDANAVEKALTRNGTIDAAHRKVLDALRDDPGFRATVRAMLQAEGALKDARSSHVDAIHIAPYEDAAMAFLAAQLAGASSSSSSSTEAGSGAPGSSPPSQLGRLAAEHQSKVSAAFIALLEAEELSLQGEFRRLHAAIYSQQEQQRWLAAQPAAGSAAPPHAHAAVQQQYHHQQQAAQQQAAQQPPQQQQGHHAHQPGWG